ncbi:decarboxylating 6-phosphogluconate dehydrogenase [bacterium]|nr:decarboxylating 6-phosphogluconate dehydrogenase [bacterium]MCI0566452.1 decarboxylating 6-phosphogluconate dehydrogenase [bacterium]
MKLGIIGFGKMGKALVARLFKTGKGYEAVAYDAESKARDEIAETGAFPARSIQELVSKLKKPRTVILLVPHSAVSNVLEDLSKYLEKNDLIIDMGNTRYTESIRNHGKMKTGELNFLDVGASGGPAGVAEGGCYMVGGDKEVFGRIEPLFRDLAGERGGYAYLGGPGAGHFVKMVHNGIEYGMMQAIAEGFNLMREAKEFDLNLPQIAELYNKGSIVESRLTEWLRRAFVKHGENLEGIGGVVAQTGEGLWTVETAKEMGVPVPVIERSVEFRKESGGRPSFIGQVLMALRNQFGGHDPSPKKDDASVRDMSDADGLSALTPK